MSVFLVVHSEKLTELCSHLAAFPPGLYWKILSPHFGIDNLKALPSAAVFSVFLIFFKISLANFSFCTY
jgi:hypothetical protein